MTIKEKIIEIINGKIAKYDLRNRLIMVNGYRSSLKRALLIEENWFEKKVNKIDKPETMSWDSLNAYLDPGVLNVDSDVWFATSMSSNSQVMEKLGEKLGEKFEEKLSDKFPQLY